MWSLDNWEKLASKTMEIPPSVDRNTLLDTHVHFDQDQTHFLAVNGTQLAIYEAPNLELLRKVCPKTFPFFGM